MVLYFGKAGPISNTPFRNRRIVGSSPIGKPFQQEIIDESADLAVFMGTVAKTIVK